MGAGASAGRGAASTFFGASSWAAGAGLAASESCPDFGAGAAGVAVSGAAGGASWVGAGGAIGAILGGSGGDAPETPQR